MIDTEYEVVDVSELSDQELALMITKANEELQVLVQERSERIRARDRSRRVAANLLPNGWVGDERRR